MALPDNDDDDGLSPCTSEQSSRAVVALVHRRRDLCISPRFVLNDFLSPRSGSLSGTSAVSSLSSTFLSADKRPVKLAKPLLARKRNDDAVLQDSLRSRFMANLDKNLDGNDADDIWTYHRCQEFRAKDPLERRLLEQGITPVYDPESKETVLCTRQLLPDVLDRRFFLVSPGPKLDDPVQCHIYRKQEPNKLYSRYKLCLSEGDRFLLAARKRKKSKTSNYVLSIDENDISNKTGNYFGKLRSNFLSTEFLFYDKGERPAYDIGCCFSPVNVRAELGGLIFHRGVCRSRQMTAVLPRLADDYKPYIFRPLLRGSSTILQKYKSGLDLDKMIVLRTIAPNWHQESQGYRLKVDGHVSKKNFQLACEGSQDSAVVVQLRKVKKDVYTMDYKFPLSPFQAFAICLANLDKK